MLTGRERLSRERLFRLRGLTAIFLTFFLLAHWSAYEASLYICRCQSFPISFAGVDTVRMALFIVIGVLYLVGWVEVVRMLYARWWPHWGTLAPKTGPADANPALIPVRFWILGVLAVLALRVVVGCAAFESDQQPTAGWQVGVWTAFLGSFSGSYFAWYIRVIEPLMPTVTSTSR